MIWRNKTPDGSGAFFWGLSGHFGSKAVTQRPEKWRIAEFGVYDASVSVCFRPKADISRTKKTPPRWVGFVPRQSISESLILFEAFSNNAATTAVCSVRKDKIHLIDVYNYAIDNSQ